MPVICCCRSVSSVTAGAGNTENVQYIIDNLEYIIGTTLEFNLEYDIANDPEADTTPSAVIIYSGEEFGEAFGEKPLYNEITFEILVQFSDSTPATIRSRSVDYMHSIREGVTIDTLNVGALAASQIVSRVESNSNDVVVELPVIQINYILTVRYREI